MNHIRLNARGATPFRKASHRRNRRSPVAQWPHHQHVPSSDSREDGHQDERGADVLRSSEQANRV